MLGLKKFSVLTPSSFTGSSYNTSDASSESSMDSEDEDNIFQDAEDLADLPIEVHDLSDEEFEGSAFASSTIAMTNNWAKRYIAHNEIIRAEQAISEPELDNRVLTKARAISFVRSDISTTKENGEYRFINKRTYLLVELAKLRRWWYLGHNKEGVQYAEGDESTWPRGLTRLLKNIVKIHFGHANVMDRIKKQLKEPICQVDIDLAARSNHPCSPNYHHDFSIFNLTFQSGSRNSSISKLKLTDIESIKVNRQTKEILVRIRVSNQR